jgi:hypothetical protein
MTEIYVSSPLGDQINLFKETLQVAREIAVFDYQDNSPLGPFVMLIQ